MGDLIDLYHSLVFTREGILGYVLSGSWFLYLFFISITTLQFGVSTSLYVLWYHGWVYIVKRSTNIVRQSHTPPYPLWELYNTGDYVFGILAWFSGVIWMAASRTSRTLFHDPTTGQLHQSGWLCLSVNIFWLSKSLTLMLSHRCDSKIKKYSYFSV